MTVARIEPVQTQSKAAIARAKRTWVNWFTDQNWKPFRYQRQVWNTFLEGESGLVHATTGTGKTYSAFGGPLIEALATKQPDQQKRGKETLRVLWITPLRALATDLQRALQRPCEDLGIPWTVETRTGDTAASVRRKQDKNLPSVLVTTPESLTLLLTKSKAQDELSELSTVVIDEWHELLSSKRGVQMELALARLRRWNPHLRVWALSATINNLEQAGRVLCPRREPLIIEGGAGKQYRVQSIIPKTMERFPWAGHVGLKQLRDVVTKIDQRGTSLVFTNTRAQAEIWYQAILRERPDWAGEIAIHHGSLDQETRVWVEQGLKTGTLRCVVCTSSLDLGVDFSPVDRVFQVGSPKGVARLMQRAGRSGHSPGESSEVIFVPTNALELIEIAAAREAMNHRRIESRRPLSKPLDLLVQHATTIALGGGFTPDDLFEEIRSTYSYQELTPLEWNWVLDFITRGGNALKAYDQYRKVEILHDGRYVLRDKKLARQHRMSIGTIASDSAMTVKFLKGGRLGTIEESFVTKLSPGDAFIFAGRALELVRIRDMVAWVKVSKSPTRVVPRWMGGRMPFSTELADSVLDQLEQAHRGVLAGPEMQSVAPIIEIQQRWSQLPRAGQLLIERLTSREGHHLFFYPFGGRLVHEGLSALLAYRLSKIEPNSFTFSVNDYGFELLSPKPTQIETALLQGLLSTKNLTDDILGSLNSTEMAKRQFREIARVACLIFMGYPGENRSAKQLQASSGLLYDVFANYDPENLLLKQSQREVLELQLEHTRLVRTLKRMEQTEVVVQDLERMTPFAFPLMVDRLREKLSSEQLQSRIARMTLTLEKAANNG